MVNKVVVLLDFPISCFLQSIGVVFKRACNVDYKYFVAILDHEVRTIVARSTGDHLVDRDLSMVGSFLESGDNPVMAGADGYHVRVAIAKDMGYCFGLVGGMASSTQSVMDRPVALGGVGW